MSYSARVVEKLSDVVEGMNVSYCSSIKKGTVAVSGSSSTIDETTFKTADLNIVVTVKVTNQTTVIKENAEFQHIDGIEPGSTLFNESYGDSYISGFIKGGEFTGIISLKVLDRSRVESTVKAIKSGLDAKDKAAEGLTLNTYGSDSSTELSTALKNTESHVSVAWMGGGQVKDGKYATTSLEFPDANNQQRPRFGTSALSLQPPLHSPREFRSAHSALGPS